jgi:type I site-specific restriction-modification system R (restriction) subunit
LSQTCPHPRLSDRRNVIVIVDEAHRSHYDDLNGYARHLRDALPHATFIAFTGTPISFADRNTRDVFGEYIELIYDLTQAVEDGATVPVYYESRLIELNLPKGLNPERSSASSIRWKPSPTTGLRKPNRAIATNLLFNSRDDENHFNCLIPTGSGPASQWLGNVCGKTRPLVRSDG